MIAAIATAVIGCDPDPVITKEGFAGFKPDTAHHAGATCGPADTLARFDIIPTDAANWNTWSIPEFQDTQRFVVGSGMPYGPLACIAARQDLDKVAADSFTSSTGALVAIIWVGDGALTPAYTRLKLHNGFNCVFAKFNPVGTTPVVASIPALGNTPGRADNRWTGYVVPSHDKVCGPVGPASQLQGFSLTSEGEAGTAYPPVARFMILNDWQPAISVRCREGWCVFGTPTPAMLPAPSHIGSVPGATGPDRTMLVVPGWYDEQQVAVRDPASGSIHAALKASIVPDPRLDSYKVTVDFDTGFVRVATIYFTDAPTDKYLADYQFHIRTVMPDTLYLRHVTTGTPHWVARINHNPRYFSVVRTPHPGAHVTGTARWAWSENDEIIWVRCEDGCCMVDDDWSSTFSSYDPFFRNGRRSGSPG